MMDLAESRALGYGYKSNPAACGSGLTSSSYFLSAGKDLISTSSLGSRCGWDLEIKSYKTIANDGEESEQAKQ